MDKNKELAKNTIIIMVGKICTQFMSFFLLPLYTAVLSTQEYGIVDLVVTYTSLLMPVVLFQIDQALFRFLIDERKNEVKKKEIISTAVSFAVVQMIAVIVIFAVIQSFVSFQYKWFLLFNVLASIGANMMLQTARGFGDNVGYAMGSCVSAATQIIGNVLFLVVLKMGVSGMLTATVLAHLMVVAFLCVKEKVCRYLSPKAISKVRLREILKYSVPLIPNALSWWVLHASDRTIVLLFLGTSYNGLLSVANKFSSLCISVYNIFNISWTESAALHMNDPDREKFFSSVIVSAFKLFMCVATGVVACMPFVFPLMVNSKFQEAYAVVPIYLLASMLNIVVGLYSVVYVALKKSKELAMTSIYSGIINIVAHLVLIKFVGLYAAALSTAIAFGVMAVYRYFDLKKYINIVLPKRWIILTIAAYAVACYGFYSPSFPIQVIVLLVIALYSVIINREILLEGMRIITHRKREKNKV